MYCSGCGLEVAGGARFCPRCGRAMQMPPPMGGWDGLMRPRFGRKIAGVCAGLSLRYGWDVGLVRLVAVLLALFTFPLGVIAYFVLWIALPEEPLYLPTVAPANHPADNAS
jgi:phage shock protein PspC (stress-responsive transcriptional regulator)